MSRTIMTATELAALPDGRYFDGTYEWDKEGDDWTPLRAPSGMPTRPTSVEARVTTVREPLHNPSAPAPAPSVAPEAAVEALSEWGIDESDVAALREAAVEAAAWKLIDRTSDLADRTPSGETVLAALTDARAALPLLTAAPSATREELSALLLTFLNPPKVRGLPWTYSPDKAADALLARFTITPKEDR